MPTLHPVPDDTPTPRTVARATAEAFASALAGLPDAEIAGWFVYVLEALDPSVAGTAYEIDVLERLRTSIDERLARGGW